MLIQNGRIVAGDHVIEGDLRITGGVIAAIEPHLDPLPGEETIDAADKLVLPGGVDAHTHMDLDVGTARATDDFYTGTVAAACGGTTTIVDHMAFGPPGCSIRRQVDAYHKLAEGRAVIDYSFHGVLDHVDDEILRELEDLIKEGVTSHKFYLTYGGKISDGEVIRLMERAAELGVMLTVHPENDGVVNHLREKYPREGKTGPIWHARSRPLECEAEAVNRMILFAHMAGDAPLYIVHLSNGLGLSYIQQARERGQKHLFAETCPQYLYLDESRYELPGDEGLKYIMSPPLRPAEHKELLWQGIMDGRIDTVATDHCPFFYGKEKQIGKDDFTKTPNGAPGVEARMALLFNAVSDGRITPGRFADLTAANPARLFGLYPKKGVLQPGSDGDVVLFDPQRKTVITHGLLHENVDYTPYEGIEAAGWPVLTISRGKVVARDGQFVGAKGAGQFVQRTLPLLDR